MNNIQIHKLISMLNFGLCLGLSAVALMFSEVRYNYIIMFISLPVMVWNLAICSNLKE